MNRSTGKIALHAALLACSLCLSGCISSTTVYEDEDSDSVKAPKKAEPIVIKAPAKKSTSSKKDPVIVTHERHFYYYPACQVYRDCETNMWFWQEGEAWKISATLPKTKKIGKEAPLMIVMDGDHPHHHHAAVSKPHAAPAQVTESSAPLKSLPAHAKGKAKGHDKQNAKTVAQIETVEQTEPMDNAVQSPVIDVHTETVNTVSDDSADHEAKAADHSKDKGKNKDSDDKSESKEKDKDSKEKSDKKDDKTDKKSKGKKKD